MFCSKCGAEIQANSKFCATCGCEIKIKHLDLEAVFDPNISEINFEKFNSKWWLEFFSKKGKLFTDGYEWLRSRNTLLEYDNHFVLIQGDEKQSLALEVISTMGLGLGALVAIGIKQLKNKKIVLTTEIAQTLFDQKLMVWCKKEDAIVWRYHEKTWMFLKPKSEQLYCKFNSQIGIIHALAGLRFSVADQGTTESIDSLGCDILNVAYDLKDDELVPAMTAVAEKYLPD